MNEMPSLRIILDGDGAWPDLTQKANDGLLLQGKWTGIAALPGGMASGRPSVSIRIDLPDGRVVWTETSMRLFLSAARAFTARYGDETWDEPPGAIDGEQRT